MRGQDNTDRIAVEGQSELESCKTDTFVTRRINFPFPLLIKPFPFSFFCCAPTNSKKDSRNCCFNLF